MFYRNSLVPDGVKEKGVMVPVERDENADPLGLLVRRESKRLGVYGGKCRLRERNSR